MRPSQRQFCPPIPYLSAIASSNAAVERRGTRRSSSKQQQIATLSARNTLVLEFRARNVVFQCNQKASAREKTHGLLSDWGRGPGSILQALERDFSTESFKFDLMPV